MILLRQDTFCMKVEATVKSQSLGKLYTRILRGRLLTDLEGSARILDEMLTRIGQGAARQDFGGYAGDLRLYLTG